MTQIIGTLLCPILGCSHCTSEEECELHLLPIMMHDLFFSFFPCIVLYLAGILMFGLALAIPL